MYAIALTDETSLVTAAVLVNQLLALAVMLSALLLYVLGFKKVNGWSPPGYRAKPTRRGRKLKRPLPITRPAKPRKAPRKPRKG